MHDGGTIDCDPGSASTFPKFLRAIAAAYGTAAAVTLSRRTLPDAAISFAELETRSAALARGLVMRGVGKGSRIGFVFGNGPDFAVAFAAIARVGAVAVPVSTLIRADELVRVLRQSDAAGLIVQRSLLGHDLVERLCDALPGLRDAATGALRLTAAPYLRWVVSTGEGLPPSVEPLATLIAAGGDVDEDLLRAIEDEVHPTDQIVEIYTSGSMALPKGVAHRHGPVLARTDSLAGMTGRTRGAVVPVPLPMFWVGGLGLFLLPSLAAGATSACTEATATNSLSAMGTVLSDEELAPFRQARPYWALGMSETWGPYAWGDQLRVPGRPLCAPLDHVAEGYEVRVADDTGREVGEGEVGEIQVRGDAVTPALHKVERDGLWTPDGFYRTGDLGQREGARIHFVGRDGDLIKTGGATVSPAEVEMEMQAIDGIHSAYVVGLPDAARGQIVAAAVVPRDGAALDFAAVEALLRGRLSGYKVPRVYLALARDAVPMLPSNKVARRAIAALLAAVPR